jgi:hypothetical protein
MHDKTQTQSLEAELTAQYGPIVTGKDLLRLLAFPSQAAFQQAMYRNQLPIPVFSIKHRRGKFALVKEVAYWIVMNRATADAGQKSLCGHE